MNEKHAIQLFDTQTIRTLWDDHTEEWYFSMVDVIHVLTGAQNPRCYWNDLKRKLKKEGAAQLYDIFVQLKMQSADSSRYYETDRATCEQLFRLIQSIPSPRVEPFKLWMTQVPTEWFDKMHDLERSIEQAKSNYKRLRYPDNWITSG